MPTPTVDVWVTKTGQDSFVINARSDMESSYDDLLDESHPPVKIAGSTYSPSRIVRLADPLNYERQVNDYAGNEDWTELEMPLDVFLSDDGAKQAWVAEELGIDEVPVTLTRRAWRDVVNTLGAQEGLHGDIAQSIDDQLAG